METTYLICAVAGGTVLLAQTLLSLLGGVGHTDIHADDALVEERAYPLQVRYLRHVSRVPVWRVEVGS